MIFTLIVLNSNLLNSCTNYNIMLLGITIHKNTAFVVGHVGKSSIT